MLVLHRGVGESIEIGPDIVVKVLEIKKGEVKLGIEAPRSIAVHRGEIAERIRRRRSTEINDEGVAGQ